MDNAALFLDYIKAKGFDPSKAHKTLELSSKPSESISRYITNQFLLSDMVMSDELKKNNINGIYGQLDSKGIVAPNAKVVVPSIFEFDTIISNGFSYDLLFAYNFNTNNYIGFCIDDNPDVILNKFECLVKILSKKHFKKFTLECDNIFGKTFGLVKRKEFL